VGKPGRRKQRLKVPRRAPVGSSPGTLLQPSGARPPRWQAFGYGPGGCEELRQPDIAALRALCQRHPRVWLNVDGLGDVEALRRIADVFGLHPLALEDVLNTHQRTKADEFPGQVFLIARMLHWNPGLGLHALEADQLSLFLGRDFVITFQEHPGDNFDLLRERLRARQPELLGRGGDYLAYELLDAVIDGYFPVLEAIAEQVEKLELEALENPRHQTLVEIHECKRDLIEMRRSVWPLREALHRLEHQQQVPIDPLTRPYLADCHDHTVQLMDLIESFRDIAASLTEIYLTSNSNRLNEVMKVLTIFSTIFMPLTFVVGVYGMNFHHMPELGWRYGYALCLLLMLAVAIALTLYFRHKGWIGRASRERDRPQSGGGPEA
jgi:magnesium transporter